MKKILYFMTSSLFCVSLLCQSSLASNSEIKNEIIKIDSTERDSFFSKGSKEYEPLGLKGYPSFYKKISLKTKTINDEEIGNSIREYSKFHGKSLLNEGEKNGINSIQRSQLEKNLNSRADNFSYHTEKFVSLLHKLGKMNKNNKSTKEVITSNENIKLLSDFVSHFEEFFQKAKNETSEGLEKQYKEVMVDLFNPFQKLFNSYMYFYDIAFPGKVEFIGYLTDWMSQEMACTKALCFTKQKIGYTRDKNGFLLFRLYPSNKIDDTYFFTYLPHGDVYSDTGMPNMEHFVQRTIFLKRNSDGNFDIVKNKGIHLSQTSKLVAFIPYTGNHEIPYANMPKRGLINDKEVSKMVDLEKRTEEALRFKELLTENKLHDKEYVQTTILQDDKFDYSSEKSFLDKLLQRNILFKFIKNILDDRDQTFVEIPSTKVDEQEAAYEYFLSLKESIMSPNNSEIKIKSIEYATLLFGRRDENDLIEIIDLSLNEIEKELEVSYFDEEKKEQEEKIKKEQEERKNMVINGDHNKKENKGNKFKKKNISFKQKNSLKETEQEDDGLSDEHIKEIRKKAHLRIEKLKKGGPVKWKSYLGLINKTVQVLTDANISVKFLLNKSSHGYISINDAKLPICNPHETGEISNSSAVKSITQLTKTVLNALSQLKK